MHGNHLSLGQKKKNVMLPSATDPGVWEILFTADFLFFEIFLYQNFSFFFSFQTIFGIFTNFTLFLLDYEKENDRLRPRKKNCSGGEEIFKNGQSVSSIFLDIFLGTFCCQNYPPSPPPKKKESFKILFFLAHFAGNFSFKFLSKWEKAVGRARRIVFFLA